MRRDLQAVIVAKTGAAWETHGGETFLSEQIAVSILDETKQALIRCHTVSAAISFFIRLGLISEILQRISQRNVLISKNRWESLTNMKGLSNNLINIPEELEAWLFEQRHCLSWIDNNKFFPPSQLSKTSECAGNAVQIMEVMFQSLVEDFTDYALEIGLQVNVDCFDHFINIEYYCFILTNYSFTFF